MVLFVLFILKICAQNPRVFLSYVEPIDQEYFLIHKIQILLRIYRSDSFAFFSSVNSSTKVSKSPFAMVLWYKKGLSEQKPGENIY